jgi:hypothetical protein
MAASDGPIEHPESWKRRENAISSQPGRRGSSAAIRRRRRIADLRSPSQRW